jgi:SAM-dependent methyltransferase
MGNPDVMQNRAAMAVGESGDDHLERLDPAIADGTLLASEHLLRYHWGAEIVAGKGVLDAGCGTGYGADVMLKAGAAKVVGVDVAEEAISRSRQLAKDAEFVVADVRSLPFPDRAFDIVTCFEVIEHVEGAQEVLAELKRVLTSDGVLLISSPNRDAYTSGNPHHVREYAPEELREGVMNLFPNVVLYRQDSLLASTITDAQEPSRSDLDGELELAAHFGTELKPGAQPYFLIAASEGALPTFRDRAAFGDLFEVKWWEEQQVRLADELSDAQARLAKLEFELDRVRAEAEHDLAEAEHDLELAHTRARDAEAALLDLESQRAAELEAVREAEAEVEAANAAVREAHETIQAMHRTNVWRLGAAWWRLRDRLLRRG